MSRKRSFPQNGEEDLSERPRRNHLCTTKMSTSDEAEKLRREESEKLTIEGLKSMMESWSEEETVRNMSQDQLKEYMAEKERLRQEHQKEQEKILEDMMPLIKMQERELKRRDRIKAAYFRNYKKKNPFKKELFEKDIKSCSSIYVCSFSYAKLESSEYKTFMESLKRDDSYKVYLGRKDTMSKIVGLVSKEDYDPKEDEPIEMLPGLYKIGCTLFSYDDSGLILTNRTREEVLRKFKECGVCDFVMAGQKSMESLVFEKDDCLTLPPHSNPKDLSDKLRKLGMPVKLSEDGERVYVDDTFRVCEVGQCVTENAAEILKHLDKKMFKYILMPLCCWSASTGETEFFDIDLPECW